MISALPDSSIQRRVLHPVIVVAFGEILTRVGAAGFLTVGGRVDRRGRLVDQVVEFERLDQIVPDQRLVGNPKIVALSPGDPSARRLADFTGNTAQLFCITRCISSRRSAVPVSIAGGPCPAARGYCRLIGGRSRCFAPVNHFFTEDRQRGRRRQIEQGVDPRRFAPHGRAARQQPSAVNHSPVAPVGRRLRG